ncbi:uncharacterized protein TM35_000771160 [Trypanosoma theileri]|uniref:Uncharacterized protein n=1 Tax=Trypanosoma theileri TaxID=67003 RepID=A0A1X0NF27_9TRYP|nr:uncharacterized protein TM35_000771160 [Trypanosoma theileri]ORC83154.1 hypothetical protein TM35_000771160 [Trypanosoma theileri]
MAPNEMTAAAALRYCVFHSCCCCCSLCWAAWPCAEHCAGVHPESVGNYLFTVNNNNNIIATVFSTLDTEKINSDDTHWARVHQFVWKYLISFLFVLVSKVLLCTLCCVSLCNCVIP